MASGNNTELFLRLEAYVSKMLESSKYWSTLVASLGKLSRRISTAHGVEEYEDFKLMLFHEEALSDFLHFSLHFSRLRSPDIVDKVVDKVVELSEFVDVYLTIRGNMPRDLGDNVSVEGVSVRVSKLSDKDVSTIAYRLFRQNTGMRISSRILSKTKGKRGIRGFLKSFFKP
ncbi:MAG: hypothetical protein ACUVQ0_04280 [Thermoproteota archaeon]